MTAEVELYQPAAPPAMLPVPATNDIDSWIAVVDDVIKVANAIYDTPFVPEGLRGSVTAVSACILAGREMGVGPMTSLQNIHVIKGKPGQSALLMRSLIQSKGHKWEDVDVTDTRVLLRGCRRGESAWTEVLFTADQAKKAGIDLGKYPQDKLYARASVRLARRKFADVIMGMPYSEEDLEDGAEDLAVEGTPAPAIEAPRTAPAPRTARRRQPAADTGDKPDPTRAPAAAASAPTAGPAPAQTAPSGDLPPLPGEDEGGDDERSPALASSGQVGIMHSHFKRLGFTDDERDQRLAAAGTIAGMPEGTHLGSLNLLTQDQAKAVIDTLSRCKDRDRLIALLVAGEMPADE